MKEQQPNFDDEFVQKASKITGEETPNTAIKVHALATHAYLQKNHPGKKADEMTTEELKKMSRILNATVEAILVQMRANRDNDFTKENREN